MRRRRGRWLLAVCALGLGPGCAGPVERATREDLEATERRLGPIAGVDDERRAADAPTVALDGSLRACLAHAFARSPSLRARFEAWRAATYGPAMARRLPEPTISYTWFIGGMDTPMGPQKHRVGVMQMFPWPTRITAASEAEALAAEAAQRAFEAEALAVAAEVTRAYWALWRVRASREVQRAQVDVLKGIGELVRLKMTTGEGGLGPLAQVDLQIARVEDEVVALDPRERAAAAELRRAIGAAPGTAVPTSDEPPPPQRPREGEAELRAAVAGHPEVAERETMSRAGGERARAAGAERLPMFGVGFEWIQIGPARDPTYPRSGMDMFMLQAAMQVPLWGRAYAAGVKQARAEGAMMAAQAAASRDRGYAELEAALAEVDDSARRIKLYAGTLVPQAETALGALQGSYQAGRASLADVLMVERDLLELESARLEARAEHAVAWAELERVVGRAVAGEDVR